jgi:hypothetical protein
MFNSFLGMSSGGGSGGGEDTPRTTGNGVTFNDVEGAADFANQLGPPLTASIMQTQGEQQGIPLPRLPRRRWVFLSPRPPRQSGVE